VFGSDISRSPRSVKRVELIVDVSESRVI